MAQTASQTGCAPVNGLKMYYEIHGEGGVPLLLRHRLRFLLPALGDRVLP